MQKNNANNSRNNAMRIVLERERAQGMRGYADMTGRLATVSKSENQNAMLRGNSSNTMRFSKLRRQIQKVYNKAEAASKFYYARQATPAGMQFDFDITAEYSIEFQKMLTALEELFDLVGNLGLENFMGPLRKIEYMYSVVGSFTQYSPTKKGSFLEAKIDTNEDTERAVMYNATVKDQMQRYLEIVDKWNARS